MLTDERAKHSAFGANLQAAARRAIALAPAAVQR